MIELWIIWAAFDHMHVRSSSHSLLKGANTLRSTYDDEIGLHVAMHRSLITVIRQRMEAIQLKHSSSFSNGHGYTSLRYSARYQLLQPPHDVVV